MNDMISVIICSIDERKFAAVSQNFASLLSGEPYEIIGIHDAKSLCEGYNRGACQSSGSILIFCHDDIEIVSHDFKYKLRSHLEEYDVVGVAGTSRLAGFNWMLSGQPHIHGVVTQIEPGTGDFVILIFGADQPVCKNIQAIDGLFLAMNRQVWEQIRFDEITFDGFHGYDLDFTFSAFLAGFHLVVCNDIAIIHQSIGACDDSWCEYQERFIKKYRAYLFMGETGLPEKGAIRLAGRDEILEMLQPHILHRVTKDIRGLAETKIAAKQSATVRKSAPPIPKGSFWGRLRDAWRSKY